jgi:hypothetical protein
VIDSGSNSTDRYWEVHSQLSNDTKTELIASPTSPKLGIGPLNYLLANSNETVTDIGSYFTDRYQNVYSGIFNGIKIELVAPSLHPKLGIVMTQITPFK